MSEIPFHLYGEDGALYTVDVIRDRREESNPHYDVDLVRSMTGRFGESLEQRLTLAEYDERDEAQAHRNEAEQMLYEQGLDGLGNAKEQVLKEPMLYDGEYLFVSYPPEAQGTDRAAAQLLWLGENGLQSERLAFGTANDMEQITSECEHDWVEGKLPNMMLGQEHPLTDNTYSPVSTTVQEIQYHFDYNLFGTDALVLEAHKAWRDSDETEGRASVVLDFHQGDSGGEVLEAFEREAERLNEMQSEQGVESAMNEAERIAVANHLLDPERDDPRLFTEGPHDPFMTARERELREQESRTIYEAWAEGARLEQEANAHLQGSAWFEATFEKSERQLLAPVDAAVNYAIVVQDADPWTLEVAVEKYWREPDNSLGIASLTLKTFDPLFQREEAEQERTELLETYEQHGLETLMHRAELTASEHYALDPHRADLKLFSEGPPDRFQTLAQRLENELNPYWNVGDDRVEEAPAPGSWEELIAQQLEEEPEPECHYWQIDYRPVETREGESLGVALFITEFPQLPPDFDDNIDKYAMDDSIYPTEVRTLEMAHFANEEDAKKFEKEFRSYLIPDLIDGPELAPEVAKLEGLSGEWQEMDYQGIVDYMSGNRTIVREESDWHLHNLNAERDARIEAEGLYTDPIYQVTTFDGDEDDPKVESAAPDLEL